jgi:hypothetical protein
MPPVYATVTDAHFLQRGIIKYGNNTIPIIGGTLSYIDLNDGVNWFAQDVIIARDNHTLQLVQQPWRSKATYISEDFGYAKVTIPVLYDEGGGGAGFTSALAPLLNSGEQYLTFDNATALLCKCKSVGAAKRKVNTNSALFETTLEFWAKEPFFKDLSQSSTLGVAVAGSSGAGTNTNQTISYTGTFYSEPTFILHVPNTNTVTISQMKITNSTSGEILTVTFSPVLTANAVHTITVDTSIFKVTDENAKEYDVSGSFPRLYNNPTGAAQNNAFVVNLVSSAATTGCTFDWTWSGRYVA